MHQKINKNVCIRNLHTLKTTLEKDNPNINIIFDNTKYKSTAHPYFIENNNKCTIDRYKLIIGTKSLHDAIPDNHNQIDAEYLLDYTKVIFHEMRHVYQMQTLYQQNNLNPTYMNMARKHLLLDCFPSYYDNKSTPYNYLHSPFEIDAEQHGLLNAVKYADTHYLDKTGKPRYDAKTILYNIYKNFDDDKWYLPKKYRQHGFDNMIKNMEGYKGLIVKKPEAFGSPIYNHNNPIAVNQFAISEKYLHAPIYQQHRIAFNNATNGIERDKILLQVALHENPAIASLFNGLSKECNAYLDKFKQTTPSTVIPSNEIYGITGISKSDEQKQNAERIARAERICRNISFDDTSYNPDEFHM